MSEVWRRKSYYEPRVLIDTSRVLTPHFDDALVCLTGAELEMLRNLTQYLHRRATFAASYQETYYYAPTEAEWDDIQAIVANLEEKLMGCTELAQLMADMLTAMQCTCNALQDIANISPVITPLVEDWLDDGTLIPTDIYHPDTAVSAKRCAIAQLTYAQLWDVLTIYLQPFQETSADVMFGVILAGFVVSIGTAGLKGEFRP
ncbi:unnamed protein product, partial [marine sediment metagenome]